MPSRSPARSSADGPILVVAVSARALTEAVVRSGRPVIAVDLFGDADTRAAATAHAVVPGSLDDGPDLAAVIAAGERLAAAHGEPAGVVVGSGFEHRPDALAALGERWPLLGCPPDAVAAVKNPGRLATLCADLSIPHPEIAATSPADPNGWVVKRAGGSGGAHVVPATVVAATGFADGHYWQRRVDGRSMSATILCDRVGARLIGVCAAAFAPTPAAPYRFGGLAGPVAVATTLAAEITAAADRLARTAGLRGLVGLDLVVDGARWWLIEVNPRPTVALDVLDRGMPPLMALHIAACEATSATGEGSATPAAPAWTPPATTAATALVYAPADGVTVAADWPDWVADRPLPGTAIPAGAPICTVRAEGDDAGARTTLLELRARSAMTLAFGEKTKH
ncbi:ATP-grasp domain-containing protein [Pseudoxanthobacter sp. M-2]|uniref:ATP-grasp domain-containing protein n=1 Tax=Pseudoxanthobacter sp. M-2 TaxID=3078754 RepID=UPI0038FC8C1F